MLLSTARQHGIDKLMRKAEREYFDVMIQKDGNPKYGLRKLNHYHKKAARIARLTIADCKYGVTSKDF